MSVRVDVLERLADLIRPLSMWKPSSLDARPAGAVKGGFVVMPSMISLLGTSHEDIREVLTALGYKRDAKLKADLLEELPAELLPSVAAATEADADKADVTTDTKATEIEPGADKALRTTAPEIEPSKPASDKPASEVGEATPIVAGQPEPKGESDAEAEPERIDVWTFRPGNPKPKVAAKRRDNTKTASAQPGKAGKGPRGKFKPKQDGAHRVHGKPPGRKPPERPADPDSPFAVLQSLKKPK